ncbi:hypothetical protein CS022_06400 [Veronia nyctiphanis]|uniref:Methylated-DNA-[protein]-cysteine S-methyltransferase DNA binding domain-containing protein n=1 Tax=Veronia nyctiphanis TaxID=1278244 RepID=A0A4Q0YS10_9GAMM|nr:MGMT family protein [Veronia nyctiphanis]RXJ73916.1 hypothetical protein CS022_06400 [Veronia nyctiphanis]
MSDFDLQIYAVLANIPSGKVVTYGDVAKMAGYPRHARHVGKLLGNLPTDSALPWYRVINAKGTISLTGDKLVRQREKLRDEGVGVSEGGVVSLRRFRWNGEPDG